MSQGVFQQNHEISFCLSCGDLKVFGPFFDELCLMEDRVKSVVPMGIDDLTDSWVILIGVSNFLAKFL